MSFSQRFVMLNLFQHNKRLCVILKQVQHDDGLVVKDSNRLGLVQ